MGERDFRNKVRLYRQLMAENAEIDKIKSNFLNRDNLFGQRSELVNILFPHLQQFKEPNRVTRKSPSSTHRIRI